MRSKLQEPESSPGASQPLAQEYQLKRQDDHGNRYVVAAFRSREEASQALARYEGKGHKQLYWVERTCQSSGLELDGQDNESRRRRSWTEDHRLRRR